MMIFSLVAMIGLEKCCITSACLQWLCHSGERTVARGPLVFPRPKKMLSGNEYTSRNSLGSAISPTDTKRSLFICFLRLGKKVTKMCFSKGGIL